jgi:hypothetical protein
MIVNSAFVYSSTAVESDDEVCQGYTVRIYEYYAVTCTIEDCYICWRLAVYRCVEMVFYCSSL